MINNSFKAPIRLGICRFLAVCCLLLGGRAMADTLVLRASGSPAAGVWPNMQVWLNGQKVGDVEVNDGTGDPPAQTGATFYTSPRDFTLTVPAIPAGRVTVDIAFTNDAVGNGQDRNLIVHSATVNGSTVLSPTTPGAMIYKNVLPDNLNSSTDIIAANNNGGSAGVYWLATLRLSSSYNLVGSCVGAAYSTINAAITAARQGDHIPVCAGTYNENVLVDKSLKIFSVSGTQDVIINGNAAAAMTLSNSSNLGWLYLSNLDLRSQTNGLTAQWSNSAWALNLYNIKATTTGDAIAIATGNLTSFVINSNTCCNLNSTAGSGIVLNSNSNYTAAIYNIGLTTKKSAVVLNGPYASGSRHSFWGLVIDTRSGDSNAHGIEVHSGVGDFQEMTARTAGKGLLFDGGTNGYLYFNRLSLYTVGDAIAVGGNITGWHTVNSSLMQTSGSGARGIVMNNGVTFSGLTISSDGDAIVNNVNASADLQFLDLTLKSTNGVGINLGGNNASGNLYFGGVTSPLSIQAKTTGIAVTASTSASKALRVENTTISGVREGIALGANVRGKFLVGSLAPVSIDASGVLSGGYAISLQNGSAPTFNNLAVNSVNGGIYLGYNVTGLVTLQGSVTKPLSITSSGSNATALKMSNNAGTTGAILDYLTLKAPAGFALQSDSNASIAQLSNFDIQSSGAAVYLATQAAALNISNGTVRASGSGANAIYLGDSGACRTLKTINGVTATAGEGGQALYVGCASTVNVSAGCFRNGTYGMYFNSNAGTVNIRSTAMNGYRTNGLVLNSDSDASVSGSCFNTATEVMAFSKMSGSSFSGNYWQGDSSDGRHTESSSNGNKVDDLRTLTVCPVAASQCPVAPQLTSLIAAYDFEDTTAWKGTTGEVKDTAGSVGGPYNGRVISQGGKPFPLQINTTPARTGSPGTCSYAKLNGAMSTGGGAIDITGLPVDLGAGAKTTVAFWMYWDGTEGLMPIGWSLYDLWFAGGAFGFNTSASDVYGIASAGLSNAWHHVVAVFANGDYRNGALYIDGVKQGLLQRRGSQSQARAVVASNMRVGGWTGNTDYVGFPGSIDQVRIYNGELSPTQVAQLYNESHNCGGQLIAEYRFEESTPYAGTAGELKDTAGYSGGPFNGKAIGQPKPTTALSMPARTGTQGTCSYASLPGPVDGGGVFEIAGLPVSTAAGAQTTVSFWMNWDNTSNVRPIGWYLYDLYIGGGKMGFNTSGNELFAVSISGMNLANSWHHIVAIFTNGDELQNRLFIDGVEMTLALRDANIPVSRNVSTTLRLGGWTSINSDSQFRYSGLIDEVKIYNGAITQAQINALYAETHACGGSGPIAEWRMDEITWSASGKVADTTTANTWRGDVGAVLDSGPYGFHGTAKHYSSSGDLPAPTASGKVCGAGDFGKEENYIDVGNRVIDRLSTAVTVMGWVKQPAMATYNYIFSNSRDCCGSYRGFNLASSYAGQTMFQVWNAEQSLINVSAGGAVVPNNVWTHVAATFEGTRVRLYVNGVQKVEGTYTATSIGSPASFSGVIGALANCPTCDANMLIDEVKIWDRALAPAEIQSVYGNENNGLNWDGASRDCTSIAPVADWHFDEYSWSGATGEVKDSSLSANHGTAKGGAMTTAAGKLCRAGDFNGATGDNQQDYLVAPIPAGGVSKKVLSASMWVYFDDLSQEQMLMQIDGTGSSGRYLYISTWRSDATAVGAYNGLHAGVANPDGTWGRGFSIQSNVFATGVWYHLAVTVDVAKGRISAYINGQPAWDAITSTGDIGGAATQITSGYNPGGARSTNARFDEMLLFNGILSKAQVKSIYTYQLAAKNWDGSARTCPTTPAIPGKLNAFETSTAAGAITGSLFTKLAGTPYSLDIIALNSASTAVDSSFEQPLKVEVLASNDINLTLDSGNCPPSGSVTVLSSDSKTVSKGRSTLSLPAEAKSWRNVRLKLSFPASGTPSKVSCSNDNYAIRPATVTVSSSANAPASGTLAANAPVVKTGANFTLTASSGTSTYAGVLALDSGKLSAQSPGVSSKQAGGNVGLFSLHALTTNADSVAATYSEVGYLYLAPGAYRDDDFTKVDADSNDCITRAVSSSAYLSDVAVNGKYGCSIGNASEVVLGRFIPDHFGITPTSVTNRSDLSCAPTPAFTYYDEDFATRFLLTAFNADGVITQNYTGQFARLNPADRNAYGPVAAGAPAGATLAAGSGASTGSFNNGLADVSLQHKVSVATYPASPATVSITVLPSDADGVTLSSNAALSVGSAALKQGRARMMNAQGTEILDLPVVFKVEAWGGTAAGWALSADDNCSPAAVTLQDGKNLSGTAVYAGTQTCVLKNSTACASSRAGRSLRSPAAAGNFNLWLRAPGSGHAGYVTVNADVPSYLEFDWAGAKADPTARATFGLRKSSPVLLRREIFGR